MNKNFKDAFVNINISHELEEKIYDMTINKPSKRKPYTKLAYISLSAIMLFAVSFSFVYAKEIKQFFQSWSSNVRFENGDTETIVENAMFKKIPPTAKKTEYLKNPLTMSENEIEDMLQFKILGYDYADSKNMGYSTELNDDGSIGRVDIWYSIYYEKEEKFIHMSMAMLNENADEGYVLAFQEGIDAVGEKRLEETYISNNLNTKVIFYSVDWTDERLTATFCYDNILYHMIGINTTEQEMKHVIENLHL